MIVIEQGITIGSGITMGEVSALATYFVEENGTDFLVSETDQYFIEE